MGHDADVIDESGLLAAVDGSFARTRRGLAQWPAPHPDRLPHDEEYERLLDTAKWRIIGARAEAWLIELVGAGVARVESNPVLSWRETPGPLIMRSDRVVPRAPGALPLIVAHSRIGDVDDAGVVLGVGEPAECVAWFPTCGCDACDTGSQDELDRLDAHILGIVSGRFRLLTDGVREVIAIGDTLPSTSGRFDRRDIDAALANPDGWSELSGAS